MVWKVKVEEVDPTVPGTTEFSGVSIGSTFIEVSDITMSEEDAKRYAICKVSVLSAKSQSNYRVFEPVEATHIIIHN